MLQLYTLESFTAIAAAIAAIYYIEAKELFNSSASVLLQKHMHVYNVCTATSVCGSCMIVQCTT